MKEKGVSPVVGTILLIAITIALAAVVATLVGGLGGAAGAAPSSILSVTAQKTGDNEVTLTISHDGGDDLKVTDLIVRAENGAGSKYEISGSDLQTEFNVGETFTVGEEGTVTYTYTDIEAGEIISVIIVHDPSNQKLFDSDTISVEAG